MLVVLNRFSKIRKSNSVTYLNHEPMFEWCVIKCKFKNGHNKNICLKIGMCVDSWSAILHSLGCQRISKEGWKTSFDPPNRNKMTIHLIMTKISI